MRRSTALLAAGLVLTAAGVMRGQDTFRVEPPPVAAFPGTPETWGDAVQSNYVVDSSELYPLAPGNHYSVFNGTLRYSTAVVGLAFIAPLHLPSGAVIASIEMDYYDASPTGRALGLLIRCDYRGQNCNSIAGDPTCGTTVCSGAAEALGYGGVGTSVSAAGTVDNFANRYYLAAGNDVTDGSVAISQFIVGYYLQVSPAPDTATFLDVPTSHPFFQYIEALYASGITAGCGGGDYCPNDPLTRGQMAVFLSKALGLQFP